MLIAARKADQQPAAESRDAQLEGQQGALHQDAEVLPDHAEVEGIVHPAPRSAGRP